MPGCKTDLDRLRLSIRLCDQNRPLLSGDLGGRASGLGVTTCSIAYNLTCSETPTPLRHGVART